MPQGHIGEYPGRKIDLRVGAAEGKLMFVEIIQVGIQIPGVGKSPIDIHPRKQQGVPLLVVS